MIGNEIPEGEYDIYPGVLTGGKVYLYDNEYDCKNDVTYHFNADKSYDLHVCKNLKPITVYLKEGYFIVVEKDVIMKKAVKTTQTFVFE